MSRPNLELVDKGCVLQSNVLGDRWIIGTTEVLNLADEAGILVLSFKLFGAMPSRVYNFFESAGRLMLIDILVHVETSKDILFDRVLRRIRPDEHFASLSIL